MTTVTSKVQIVNQALASIASRSTIADLNEGSTEAITALTFYDTALDATLRAAHWNFARAQILLTLLGDATKTPTPDPVPTPWVYEYAYPSDCVLARYVMPQIQAAPVSPAGPGYGSLWTGPAVRFLVSADKDANGNDETVILSNQPNALLVYTRRITNVALFDPQFVTAFSNYLGALMCPQITGDKQKQSAAFQIAHNTTIAARAMNGNEGLTVMESVPDWIRVRGYITDYGYPPGGMEWVQQPQNLSLIA